LGSDFVADGICWWKESMDLQTRLTINNKIEAGVEIFSFQFNISLSNFSCFRFCLCFPFRLLFPGIDANHTRNIWSWFLCKTKQDITLLFLFRLFFSRSTVVCFIICEQWHIFLLYVFPTNTKMKWFENDSLNC